MTTALPAPTPPIRDFAWLKRFWLWSIVALVFAAIFALVIGATTSDPIVVGVALALAGFGAWLAIARRRVQRGQEAFYVIWASLGQYALMLALLPVIPELAATIVPAALIPVFVAIPYLQQPAVTRFAAAVWSYCLAYAFVAYQIVVSNNEELVSHLVARGAPSESIGLVAARLTRVDTVVAAQLLGAIVVTGFMLGLLRRYSQAHESASYLAVHDPLTGLPTRALFMDRLEHALQRCQRRGGSVAVVFLDIDSFKAINDGHGHSYGDEVLRRVGARISEITRASDTTARLGGDEFAIILEDLDELSDAEAAAGRLRLALEDPIEMPEGSFPVRLSMGIAFSGVGGETADALLRSADDAMYESKRGRQGELVAYQPAMRVASAERVAVKRSFQGVVERGELRLQYQPLVKIQAGGRDAVGLDAQHHGSRADTPTGDPHDQSAFKSIERYSGQPAAAAPGWPCRRSIPGADAPAAAIVGVEALVRWQDPERGWRLPAQFVSLAEETGDIVPIGRWVLQEAAREVAEWRRSTPEKDLWVSVNLSARQLVEDSFDHEVMQVLDDAGLPPSALVLEISERLLERDTLRVVSMLRRLRTHGIRLAIDDFGTGYSSLGSLKDFPVDLMKIDRSLVTDAVDDHMGTAVLRAAVDVGLALDAEVVAEGIETAEQLLLLRSMQCHVGQGYLFARPLDSAAMAALLRADTKTWDSLLRRNGVVDDGNEHLTAGIDAPTTPSAGGSGLLRPGHHGGWPSLGRVDPV